jgi:hypothetical protein
VPRFGAVGQHGSIAVVERLHRTLKELLRLTTIPEDQTAFERELGLILDWYNEHRPYETLDGKTPNEVHYARPAANERPRFEPRTRWPRGSPCAAPQVGVAVILGTRSSSKSTASTAVVICRCSAFAAPREHYGRRAFALPVCAWPRQSPVSAPISSTIAPLWARCRTAARPYPPRLPLNKHTR